MRGLADFLVVSVMVIQGTLDVSYLYEPWRLRVGAFGRNLLNEKYNLSRFVNDFVTNDIIAPLATYGVRVNWDF